VTVASAYGARSAEYTALFGDIEAAHPDDRALVEQWAAALDGPVLDVGCGPGQWSARLHALGVDITGIDLTPEFVRIARARHPQVDFRLGDVRRLDLPDAHLAGVLAWFSLIHLPPADAPVALAEIRRVLRPGGGLVLGFFDGPDLEPFPHAVTTAWFRSPTRLAADLERAGFQVVRSVQRQDPGARPCAVIVARAVESEESLP